MPARHIQRGHEGRSIKPGQGSLYFMEMKHRLILRHVNKRAVVVLFGHRAGSDLVKQPFNPYRIEDIGGRNERIQPLQEIVMADLPCKRISCHGLEEGNTRKRGQRVFVDPVHIPCSRDLENAAIKHQHLAIKIIEGSQTEITMLFNFSQGYVLLIDPLH